jgi:undecaprenyl-diphosphatase
MDNLQIVILAIIQGLTEFLPISSSAHLVLVPQMLNWPDQGLVFDVAVHIGSLIAVLYYFRVEVKRMLVSWTRSLAGGDADQDSLLAWWIIIGTVPAVLAGFLLQGPIEENLRSPWVVALASISFGLLLWYADTSSRRTRNEFQLNLKDVPDPGHFAFRYYNHAGTVSRAHPQGGGKVFIFTGDAGDFR